MSAFRDILRSSRTRDAKSPPTLSKDIFDGASVTEPDDSVTDAEEEKKAVFKPVVAQLLSSADDDGQGSNGTSTEPVRVVSKVRAESPPIAESRKSPRPEKQEFTVPLFDRNELVQVSDDSDQDSTGDAFSMFFSPAEYEQLSTRSSKDAIDFLETTYGRGRGDDASLVQLLLDNLECASRATFHNTINALLFLSIGRPDPSVNGGKGDLKRAQTINKLLGRYGALNVFSGILYQVTSLAFPKKVDNAAQTEQISPNASRRGKQEELCTVLNLFFVLLYFHRRDPHFRDDFLKVTGRVSNGGNSRTPLFGFFVDLIQQKALIASSSKKSKRKVPKSAYSFPLRKVLILANLSLRLTTGKGLKEMRGVKVGLLGDKSQVKSRIYSLNNREERARERRMQLILKGIKVADEKTFVSSDESVRLLRNHLHVPYAAVKNPRGRRAGEEEDVPLGRDRDRCGVGAIEQVYRWLYPKGKRIVLALIQIILATSPEDSGYSKSLINVTEDFDQDLARYTALPDATSADVPSSAAGFDCKHHATYHRDMTYHKSIVARSASQIILLLLKSLRQNHVVQGEMFSQVLADAKISLVLLRWINIDLQQFISAGEKGGEHVGGTPAHQGIVVETETENKDQNGPGPKAKLGQSQRPAWARGPDSKWDFFTSDPSDTFEPCFPSHISRNRGCILLNILRILQRVHKHAPAERIETHLLQYKAAFVLRKILMCGFTSAQYYGLKLVKIQAKYMGKKWKQMNMRIISAIHRNIRADLDDDWLVSSNLEEDKEGFTEEDVRRVVKAYNDFHFGNGYYAASESQQEALELENIIEGSQCSQFMGSTHLCRPFHASDLCRGPLTPAVMLMNSMPAAIDKVDSAKAET